MRILNSQLQDNISLLNILIRNKSKTKKADNLSSMSNSKSLRNSYLERISINLNGKSECYDGNQQKLSKPGLAELDGLNFHFDGCQGNKGTIIHNGKEYAIKELPDVKEEWCQDIVIKDGLINFDNGNYYKWTDTNGNTYTFSCSNNHLSQPLSEQLKERQNDEAVRFATFWNILKERSPNITEYDSKIFGLTKEKQREYLDSVGIKPNSFFTVNVGDVSREYYYSNSDKYGLCMSKKEYDDNYKFFTEDGSLKDYPEGTKIIVDGQEYTVSAEHNINVPYGVDIFNFKMPSLQQM